MTASENAANRKGKKWGAGQLPGITGKTGYLKYQKAKREMERKHKATYATDTRKGGYMIRVEGPNAEVFAGRTVPVTRKDLTESEEKLTRLIWTGPDKESGAKVALYNFEAHPRDETEADIPF